MAYEDLRGEWKLVHCKSFNCREQYPNGKVLHVFSEGDIIKVDKHMKNDWCMLAKPENLKGAFVRLSTVGQSGRAWVRVQKSWLPVKQAPVEYKYSVEIPEVSEVINRYHKTGYAGVLVTRNGHVIHLKGYGEGSSNSTMRLLSVTKQFAAMCAAMLIEEGKLEMIGMVSQYLPELNIPINGRALLIQDLIRHTCGLADFLYAKGPAANKYLSYGSRSNKSHAEWLATMEPPGPPGVKFSYNNSGYVLLTRVIEVIAGEPFHKFQQRRIFDVLEMSYAADNTSFNGSGTLGMTMADYAKWDLALWREDGRLLSPSGYQMLFSKGTLDNGDPVNYGFGWMLWDTPKWVHHSGSGGGWGNLVKRYTLEAEDNTTVAIFTRADGSWCKGHTAHDEVHSVVKSLATTANPLPRWDTGEIYYCGGKDGTWEKIDGWLSQISVSGDGSHVWGTHAENGNVWYRNGKDGTWEKIDGKFSHVCVSSDGSHIWGTSPDGTIWYRNGRNGSWEKIPGGLSTVSVSGDGCHVWGAHATQTHYRNGKEASWEAIDGGFSSISVSDDGSHVWCTQAPSENVYYRNGKDGSWERVDDGQMSQVSVSGDGSHVWGTNAKGQIYYRNGKEGLWERIGGDLGCPPCLFAISVSGDGCHIWGRS